MSRSVKVGETNGCSVWLDHAVRQTHMHVIGLSRTGKSKFLEHLIRQDIMAGHGVCVIDPHGTLYDAIADWMAVKGLHQCERIHLINPSDAEWTVGFNPLAESSAGLTLSTRIDAMVDACVKVWGGGDVNQTPRLGRCLQVIFGALASHGHTLAEWQFFANWSLRHLRAHLPHEIDDPVLAREWDEIDNGMKQSDFTVMFESTRNRLLEFTKAECVRDMVGQRENVIDFKRCMDEGHIVLVNLRPSARLSKRNSQVLGALIANALYATAFTRSEAAAKAQPFYAYIDECGQYLTKDVANSLDETAKYGLHYVLSHQRLGQLAEHGPELLNAVMAGAQVKVVFNCDDEDMAEPLARHLFRKLLDVRRMKGWITQPVVIGYETIELEGSSVSETESRVVGESRGASTGLNATAGVVMIYDANGQPIGGHSASEGSGASASESVGRSVVEGHGRSNGRSVTQTLRPILDERALTPFTLDEQLHEAIVAIRSLKQRHAFLYHRDIGVIPIETPFVRADRVFADENEEFGRIANQRSAFTSRRRDVQAAIRARAAAFGVPEGAAPGSFFE